LNFRESSRSVRWNFLRIGFAWMGAAANSKTIWYSVCHLKFNNIRQYFQERIMGIDQNLGASTTPIEKTQQMEIHHLPLFTLVNVHSITKFTIQPIIL